MKKYGVGLLVILLTLALAFMAYQSVRAEKTCSGCSGCGKNSTASNSNSYGKAISDNQVVTVKTLESKPADYTDKTVKVEGKIVKLCPAGCWFNLDDGTGVIHVTLNSEEFVMPQESLNSIVVVEGVFDYEDDYASIFASGVKVVEM